MKVECFLIIEQDGDIMNNSFDIVALVHEMRKENPDEKIFIDRTNNKGLVINVEDQIHDICGFVMICKPQRDIAVNPDHIISIFNQGDIGC